MISTYVAAGFALFAMFFGAGNVMYPILLGQSIASNDLIYAILGFCVTGVILPYLGIIGICMYDGKETNYYSTLNKYIKSFMLLIIMIIIGPLGGIPRCMLVSHGAVSNVMELFDINMSFIYFAAIYSIISLFIIYQPHNFIGVIGKILTPVLILAIVIIVGASIVVEPSDAFLSSSNWNLNVSSQKDNFFQGLFEGYNTMDLIASVFFATTVYSYIKMKNNSNNLYDIRISTIKASLVAASIHMLSYVGLIYAGNKFKYNLEGFPKEQLLLELGSSVLDSVYAKSIVAILIVLACLTTSITLTVIATDYFSKFFDKLHIEKRIVRVIITVMVSFFSSLLGLDKLMSFVISILLILYPAITAFAVGRLVDMLPLMKKFGDKGIKVGHWLFYAALLWSSLSSIPL